MFKGGGTEVVAGLSDTHHKTPAKVKQCWTWHLHYTNNLVLQSQPARATLKSPRHGANVQACHPRVGGGTEVVAGLSDTHHKTPAKVKQCWTWHLHHTHNLVLQSQPARATLKSPLSPRATGQMFKGGGTEVVAGLSDTHNKTPAKVKQCWTWHLHHTNNLVLQSQPARATLKSPRHGANVQGWRD